MKRPRKQTDPKPATQPDPTGRADIAVMAIADRLAAAFFPNEWPTLRPLAAIYAAKLAPQGAFSVGSVIQTAVKTATKGNR